MSVPPATDREQITRAAAELRHLYRNLVSGQVRSVEACEEIAKGLLAPQIQRLERVLNTWPALIDTSQDNCAIVTERGWSPAKEEEWIS